jgi:hypothetical protein
MNVRSSSKVLVSTKSDTSGTQIELRRLPQYAVCAGLGMLGGAVGVAVAIGLAILVQLLLPPSVVLQPGIIPLMVLATMAGLGVSWLFARMIRHVVPGLLNDSPEKELQVILVFSVFTSLLQTILFFARV